MNAVSRLLRIVVTTGPDRSWRTMEIPKARVARSPVSNCLKKGRDRRRSRSQRADSRA